MKTTSISINPTVYQIPNLDTSKTIKTIKIKECFSKLSTDKRQKLHNLINYISVSSLFKNTELKIKDGVLLNNSDKGFKDDNKFTISLDDKMVLSALHELEPEVKIDKEIAKYIMEFCSQGISTNSVFGFIKYTDDMLQLLDNLNMSLKGMEEITSLYKCLYESDVLDVEKLCQISGHYLMGINLSRLNLSGVNLSGANLMGANFQGAQLSKANLHKAILIGANMNCANLRGAILIEADLSGSNLSEAILITAKLPKANLSKANLNSADLINTNLSEANLSYANLSESDLFKANLIKANLNHANMSKANLENSFLNEATLIGANLIGANLNTNLDGIDLSKAKLKSDKISKINFNEAIFHKKHKFQSP